MDSRGRDGRRTRRVHLLSSDERRVALDHSGDRIGVAGRSAEHRDRAVGGRYHARTEREHRLRQGRRRRRCSSGSDHFRRDRPHDLRAARPPSRILMAKIRADLLLVSRGLAESRTRAQALIMAGAVFCGERKIAKAGDLLAEDAPLEVRGKEHPWVSRGGVKLDHGLTHFGLDAAGVIALDVGSSTGGFTDVLLARGAARVYAVDVGTNQLAWKLRQDPRGTVLGQTNARYLTSEHGPEPGDIVACEASFLARS